MQGMETGRSQGFRPDMDQYATWEADVHGHMLFTRPLSKKKTLTFAQTQSAMSRIGLQASLF
ncbi:MAG TPA: hypothetical protein DCF49_05705 [Lachnospiraceae bacterium]|nr:hypothetical protein [Lachnospiraceae bacterium]